MQRLVSRRARDGTFLLVGLVSVTLAIVLYLTDSLRGMELDTVDARFHVRGEEEPDPDIALVEIDDVTLDEVNRRWPFPRSLHADVINRLREDGAHTIVYDIQFTEPTVPQQDNALIQAVARAGRVVLGTAEVDRLGRSKVFGGEEVLREIGARSGNAGYEADPGGVIHRAPYELDGLKGLAVVGAEEASGRPVDPGDVPEDGYWIDYAGDAGTYPGISFSSVLAGRVPRGTFEDKTVVVGASAARLHDLHQAPFSRGEPISGVEVLANSIASVRAGFPLAPSPAALDILLIAILGLVAPAASLRLSPLRALGVAVLAGAVYVVAVQLAFDAGTILPLVYPLVALTVSCVGSLVVDYALVALERARVRWVFARFVPEQVVSDVLDCTDGDLRLGGMRRECTVMFADLRGFTAFAEPLPPDRVIDVLNHYLEEMSDAIMEHGGTLVAYMGDGIFAVFGAPLDQPDHADRAVSAAREMLNRLERFNAWVRDEDLGDGFRIGIGLNTGEVMSGNVGSQQRLEYTAIGDTTNTASRLEAMTKGTPHQIFAAESVRTAMQDGATALEFVDELPVRGREQPIRVWTLA